MNFGMTSAFCQCVANCEQSLCLLSGYWKTCQLVVLFARRAVPPYLMRTHHVVEPDHNRWKSMTLHVAFHDHLSGCFAGGVRVRRV
jgi:hypothetical protein